MKHNGEEQGTRSLMLEKLGQAAMLKMCPTRCTRQTLHMLTLEAQW